MMVARRLLISLAMLATGGKASSPSIYGAAAVGPPDDWIRLKADDETVRAWPSPLGPLPLHRSTVSEPPAARQRGDRPGSSTGGRTHVDIALVTVPTVFAAAPGTPSLLAPWPASERWRLDDGSLSRHHGDLRVRIERGSAAAQQSAHGTPEMLLREAVGKLEAPPGPAAGFYISEDRFSSRDGSGMWRSEGPLDALLDEASPELQRIRLPVAGGAYAHAGVIPFRWFLLGGRGSGVALHREPHHSMAWNACIAGSKRWVLFPPDTAPGVLHLDAGGDTASWFEREYPRLARLHADAPASAGIGMVEGVQRSGEVVVVPPRWWHVVINLEPTVALTMNFVREADVGAALLEEAGRPSNAAARWRGALPLRQRLAVELARARQGQWCWPVLRGFALVVAVCCVLVGGKTLGGMVFGPQRKGIEKNS
jgi:hypothetical protein